MQDAAITINDTHVERLFVLFHNRLELLDLGKHKVADTTERTRGFFLCQLLDRNGEFLALRSVVQLLTRWIAEFMVMCKQGELGHGQELID